MTRFAGFAVLGIALIVAAPGAAQAATCTPPKYPGSGYFTSLNVTQVSCSTGRAVALAFHRCRTKSSGKGRCTSRVREYRCTEKRVTISTEINGRVTCTRGASRVKFTYQHNT
jgi:hypothetical protein